MTLLHLVFQKVDLELFVKLIIYYYYGSSLPQTHSFPLNDPCLQYLSCSVSGSFFFFLELLLVLHGVFPSESEKSTVCKFTCVSAGKSWAWSTLTDGMLKAETTTVHYIKYT